MYRLEKERQNLVCTLRQVNSSYKLLKTPQTKDQYTSFMSFLREQISKNDEASDKLEAEMFAKYESMSVEDLQVAKRSLDIMFHAMYDVTCQNISTKIHNRLDHIKSIIIKVRKSNN